MRKNSVVYHIGRIRRRVNRFLEQELKQHRADDLVVSQGAILATLYQHSEKLTMKAIAAIVRRDKSTITYLIDKLIDMGYVTKCPSDQDGRVIFIELTDKAHQFEGTFNAISTRLIEKVYTGLTETEAVELERLLEKVEQNFEEFE